VREIGNPHEQARRAGRKHRTDKRKRSR
jgi:hypothetical protein